MPGNLLTSDFTLALQELVTAHHNVYPRLPPRDIFFEDLVARAFRNSGQTDISLSTPGRSREDMTVAGVRLSIKTETGYGTRPDLITITKLSTTEETEWTSEALINRILHHLAEYERMLMLRAIWYNPPCFHYQLLDIPTALLGEMASITVEPTGRRKVKPSLRGTVYADGERCFDVFFDATDGKCAIRNLAVNQCLMLLEWDHVVPPEWHDHWPTRTFRTYGRQAKRHAGGGRGGPSSSGDPQ